MKLGAGRLSLDDKINPRVGIVLTKKPGDYINKGDIIAKIFSDDVLDKNIYNLILNAYRVEDVYNKVPLIIDIIK